MTQGEDAAPGNRELILVERAIDADVLAGGQGRTLWRMRPRLSSTRAHPLELTAPTAQMAF